MIIPQPVYKRVLQLRDTDSACLKLWESSLAIHFGNMIQKKGSLFSMQNVLYPILLVYFITISGIKMSFWESGSICNALIHNDEISVLVTHCIEFKIHENIFQLVSHEIYKLSFLDMNSFIKEYK